MNKKKWTILSIIVFFVILVAGFIAIHSMEEAVGENPINGLNQERMQVLPVGEKYVLNHEQEEVYQQNQEKQKQRIEEEQEREDTQQPVQVEEKKAEPEEKQQDLKQETLQKDDEKRQVQEEGGKPADSEKPMDKPGEETENPEIPDVPSEPDNPLEPEEPTEPDSSTEPEEPEDSVEPEEPEEPEDPGDEEVIDKTPTMITSLAGIDSIEGTRLTFTLEGRDYRGYKIGAEHFTAYVNGMRIYSAGEDNYKRTYRADLTDGENEIILTIADNEGNTVSHSYTVYCNAGGEMVVGGNLHLTIDVRVLGLDYLLDTDVEFFEGDSISHVVEKGLTENGFGFVSDGSNNYGWYLRRIEKPGITDGWSIPDPILYHLEENGSDVMGYEEDSLGASDFYKFSGWMYMQNGMTPDVGMASKDAEDGDEIYIYYTLEMGNEFNGIWFDGTW